MTILHITTDQDKKELDYFGIDPSTGETLMPHNDIVLEDIVHNQGSFVVTKEQADYHVWDLSQDPEGSDQWQHKFESRRQAVNYINERLSNDE